MTNLPKRAAGLSLFRHVCLRQANIVVAKTKNSAQVSGRSVWPGRRLFF
jgi:hypothetical protein